MDRPEGRPTSEVFEEVEEFDECEYREEEDDETADDAVADKELLRLLCTGVGC